MSMIVTVWAALHYIAILWFTCYNQAEINRTIGTVSGPTFGDPWSVTSTQSI